MKKIFLDVETTGTDENRHSIHQLSAIIEIDDTVVERVNLFMCPHPKAAIEQEALNVSKVTAEQILAYPDYKEQFIVFRDILNKYIDKKDKTDKFFMIGFKNASFDDGFIKKLHSLCNDPFWLYYWPSSIDVSCLAAQYLQSTRHTMPSFKLSRVAKTLGIYVDDSRLHDGIYDCELTRNIYRIVTGLDQEGLI